MKIYFTLLVLMVTTLEAKQWWTTADGPDKALRCGPEAPKIDGQPPICNPASKKFHCCNIESGLCGMGSDFCSCENCVNYRPRGK